MKKVLIALIFIMVITSLNSCGGSSSTYTSGKTTVSINLGQTKTASPASGGLLSVSATIPSSIVSIRFTISATDMATIQRTISVEGRTTITESFDVQNGANRYFLVEAMDSAGNVLYKGDTYADLDGTPVTLTIVMVSMDVTPPTFSGLSAITSITDTSMTLSWSPATDNITSQDRMQYIVYMSTTSGGENFSLPSFTTSAGVTSFSVTGLSPSTTYYFVVRAKDEAGNIDTNTVEKFATTLSPPDTTAPTFGGLVSATAASSTGISLTWNPATDNVTASSNIVYLIYMSTTSGGENFAIPSFTTSAGATSFTVAGLNSSTTYYFVVRAKDEAGNIDTNTVEKFATTLSPPDTTPPTFGGIVSAIPASSTEISLTWNSATDNVSASSNIVYLIYMATTRGGENFSSPSFTTSAGATSFKVTGLSPNTTYYFVIRAKDEAGNIDTNTVEKGSTTPYSVSEKWAHVSLYHKNTGLWGTIGGIITFNNDGTGTNTYKSNDGGVLTSGSMNFTYSTITNLDGSISLTITDTDGRVETLKLVISDDGKMVIRDGTADTTAQEFSVAIKIDASKTYSNADLSGDYYGIAYEHDALGSTYGYYRAESGILSANGSGSCSMNSTLNGDGSILTKTQSGTYVVNADGSVVFIGGSSYLTGDGKLAILSNPDTVDDWANYIFMKKADITYSTAGAAGTWALACFGDDNGNSFNAEFGTLTCDSNGNCTYSLKNQRDGTITYESGSITVSVASDGSFGTSLASGAPSYAGAAGNNGNTIIFNPSFDQTTLYHREICTGVRCTNCSNLSGAQVSAGSKLKRHQKKLK